MKIAVISINIGNYICFWEEFYRSAQEYFLPGHEKFYYVFTDHEDMLSSDTGADTYFIEQKNLGWPDNTLMRFHMFHKIRNQLKEYDYIFYLNANILFIQNVGEEILPAEQGMVFVKKIPVQIKKRRMPYEKNPNSTAFVPDWEEETYIRGGFFGGKPKEFLNMSEVLAEHIEIDKKNGIVAMWHDESHLCRYVIGKQYKILAPGYLYPEGWVMPCKKYVLLRKKDNLYLRYGTRHSLKDIKSKIKLLIRNTGMRVFIFFHLIKVKE